MAVETRHIDDSKGKGLFAKTDFKSGAIIFEENPIVCCQFSWNKLYEYKACDHCLRPLETAQENARRLTNNSNLELPYMECCTTDKSSIRKCDFCDTNYCSESCKKTAFEQYHKTICFNKDTNPNHPLERLDEAWRQMHYPPETNSVMLIVRLLARILQSPDRDLAVQQTLQFCHRTINEDAELAHKLLGDKFADQVNLLHNLLIEALPYEGVQEFLTPTGFQTLLALIGTNAQGVGTSPISQWIKKTSELCLADNDKQSLDMFIDKLYEDMDTFSGTFLNSEGVALFSLQSACNHSCVPNAEAAYLHNSSTISLVALRDIQAGEEISVSYLDSCNLERSRHSRRKILMENYLFACNCQKCEEEADNPDTTSEEEEDSGDEDMSD